MPIVLKLGELVSARPAIDRLSKLELPITTSYRLAKKLKVVLAELGDYDKKHNELVVKLGRVVPDKPGHFGIGPTCLDTEGKVIPDINWPSFVMQENELLSLEISLSIEPIKLADLVTPSGTANILSVGDMGLLSPLLSERAEV